MKEPLIRQRIGRIEDDLVGRAEQRVDSHQGVTSQLEDKQLRNVIAVAEETESLAVVENFVKYQIGRDDKEKDWAAGKPGFGEGVLQDLGWIRKQAESLADASVGKKDLEIRMARLYLGYMMRYFKYAQAVSPSTGGAAGGER
jgi:hypothetical protein